MVLLSIDFANLHTILETLYGEMMPLCKDMMDVGKGLAWLRPAMRKMEPTGEVTVR